MHNATRAVDEKGGRGRGLASVGCDSGKGEVWAIGYDRGVWARDSNGQVTPLCEVSLHRGPAPDSGQDSRTRRRERERERGGRGARSPVKKGVRKASDQAIPTARTRREKRERKKENETVAVLAKAGGTVCCATGSGSSCRRHRK